MADRIRFRIAPRAGGVDDCESVREGRRENGIGKLPPLLGAYRGTARYVQSEIQIDPGGGAKTAAARGCVRASRKRERREDGKEWSCEMSHR